MLRSLRTLAARAFATAHEKRGVVHINMPFRKPLESSPDDAGALRIERREATRFIKASRAGQPAWESLLTDDLLARRGIIYFGHGSCRSARERRNLTELAEQLSRVTGYPIFAEFTSNMRAAAGYPMLSAYECLLASQSIDVSTVEVLIRFGTPPLAKVMQDFVAEDQLRYHIYCSRAGEWADDSHTVTHQLTLDPVDAPSSEWAKLPSAPAVACLWRDQLLQAEIAARQVIADEIGNRPYFDGAAVFDVVDLMPADGVLFAGNSLPVRHLDQFACAGC